MATSRRFLPPVPPIAGRPIETTAPPLEAWLKRVRDLLDNGLPAGFNDVDPTQIQAGVAADPGEEGDGWAAASHVHDIYTAAPGPITFGTTAAEGTSAALARSDHRHDTTGLTFDPVVISVTISANQNDWAPGNADVYWLDSDTNRAITGLVVGDAVNGEERKIIYVGTTSVSLNDQDSGSAAASQFVCPGNVPLVLNPGDMALLVRDGPRSRWHAYELVGGAITAAADPGWVEFWWPPNFSQAPA